MVALVGLLVCCIGLAVVAGGKASAVFLLAALVPLGLIVRLELRRIASGETAKDGGGGDGAPSGAGLPF